MIACFFDFDSTIVTKESLDEVIALALDKNSEKEHYMAEVERLTNLGMEGKMLFTESAEKRLQFCPVTQDHFLEVGKMLEHHITKGFPEIIKNLQHRGIRVFIVSGGFAPSIYPVATQLGIAHEDVYANEPIFDKEGQCLGVDNENLLWTNQGKSPVTEYLKSTYNFTKTILVGDGNNDYKAYERGSVDSFIGFGGNVVRKSVKEKALLFAHNPSELLTLLNQEL